MKRMLSVLALLTIPTVGLASCYYNNKNKNKSQKKPPAEEPSATIVVPDSATSAPAYELDGRIPERRYVIRMSDGQRDWEVELPERPGYEMRIPLEAGKPAQDAVVWESEQLTEADKELLRTLRRQRGEMEKEGIFLDGQPVADGSLAPAAQSPTNEQPAPSRPSYLLGIEEVNRLYKSGNHELALVRLGKLEKSYPDDPKLLAMKGTLWLKLGHAQLARDAWEKALQIDPNNKAVIQALKRLRD